MAEEKKSDSAPKNDIFVDIVSWIIIALLVSSLLGVVSSFLSSKKLLVNGWSGLSTKNLLLSQTRPIHSLENPIGAKVIANKGGMEVYDKPGGKVIGKHSIGDSGQIKDGPMYLNGEKYWYVDFDKGADGWVKENEISSPTEQFSFISKFILRCQSIFSVFKVISVIVSLLLILFATYLIIHLTELRRNENALKYPIIQGSEKALEVNPKWERIQTHLDSLNENDWRLAIMEADIMLGEILDNLFLPGETMGEKMKMVEKSDFTTIDLAWEAHKIRNQIAHEGSDFALTSREARRVIDLYKQVFDEFKII